MNVTLTQEEVWLGQWLGKCANKAAANKGQYDTRTPDAMTRKVLTNLEIQTMGYWGQIAWCKAMNTYQPIAFKPDIYDAISQCGRTVDVKTCQYRSGSLAVGQDKIGRLCDVYVLVTGEVPHYIIRGYMAGDDVITRPGELNGKPCFRVSQSELYPTIEEAMNWREK